MTINEFSRDYSNQMLFGLVIVTYNRSTLLRRCLQTLVQSNNWLYVKQLYIVDNNSSDATETVVKSFVSKHPTRITYLKMTENLGGAGGFEGGCRQAYDDGLEWIGLLDDDVILDSNCLLLSESRKDARETRCRLGFLRRLFCSSIGH